MQRRDVIDTLRSNAEAIRRFGVTALYLYGSAARDEIKETSDIDLFADVDYARFGFEPFMQLRDFLKSIMQRNVDFTTRNALHPDLREQISRSAIKVFDAAKVDSLAAE
jgi:hypothetical protein